MGFGIGWSEVVVVILVAILVIKPDRLPETARFAAKIYRQARNIFYTMSRAFETEVEELKKLDEPLRQTKALAEKKLASLGSDLYPGPETDMDPDPAIALTLSAKAEVGERIPESSDSPDNRPPEYPDYAENALIGQSTPAPQDTGSGEQVEKGEKAEMAEK
jgi:sec-independent protein translocase protein TatB